MWNGAFRHWIWVLNEAMAYAFLPMPIPMPAWPSPHFHVHMPIADTHAHMPSASEFTLPTFIPQLPDQDCTAHLLLIAAEPFNTVLLQQLWQLHTDGMYLRKEPSVRIPFINFYKIIKCMCIQALSSKYYVYSCPSIHIPCVFNLISSPSVNIPYVYSSPSFHIVYVYLRPTFYTFILFRMCDRKITWATESIAWVCWTSCNAIFIDIW